MNSYDCLAKMYVSILMSFFLFFFAAQVSIKPVKYVCVLLLFNIIRSSFDLYKFCHGECAYG